MDELSAATWRCNAAGCTCLDSRPGIANHFSGPPHKAGCECPHCSAVGRMIEETLAVGRRQACGRLRERQESAEPWGEYYAIEGDDLLTGGVTHKDDLDVDLPVKRVLAESGVIETHGRAEVREIIDCVNGRDYLALDLSAETAITLTLNDRQTGLPRGATRLVFDEVGRLHDVLDVWLTERLKRPLGKEVL